MTKKDITLLISIIISGALVYMGICKMMGYPVLNKKDDNPIAYNQAIPTNHEGDSVPAIDLLLSDSSTHLNTVNISSNRWSILVYFSPYCPFCQSQITEIKENIAQLKNIDFILLTTYSMPEIKSFSRANQLQKYPNIIVGCDYNNKFSEYFKTQSIPYLAIYNPNKKLNSAFLGEVKYQQLKFICKK